MADISTLARPYAKAVFELARDSGKLAQWGKTLQALAEAVAAPQLRSLIGNPALTKADLAAVLGQALAKDVSGEGLTLLKLLVENGRLKTVGSISEQFEALRAEAESRVDVEIVSAVPVEKAQKDALAAAIGKRLKREVVIEWTTDESLIAGARIRAGDLVIDGSVQGELDKLHTALAR
ncbi:MAG TPA: F0F1 ATP synthase subunit delta [Solimonas sp.]|nr:F0F1 ATP synthase subunit delta [Solimonas sp.]